MNNPPGFVHGHEPSRDQFPATLGQQTSANSLGVVLASDQPSIPTTSPNGTAPLNLYVDYSVMANNVTNTGWTTLTAATGANIKSLLVTDTCGQVMRVATGAAGFEVDLFRYGRGGLAVPINIFVAAGTRLAIQCQTAALVNAGDSVILGLA